MKPVYPKAWITLSQQKRSMLFAIAEAPKQKLVVISPTTHELRHILELRELGLLDMHVVTREARPGINPRTALRDGTERHYGLYLTNVGRWLLGEVQAIAEKEAGRQLWGWLKYGAGLDTRKDF